MQQVLSGRAALFFVRRANQTRIVRRFTHISPNCSPPTAARGARSALRGGALIITLVYTLVARVNVGDSPVNDARVNRTKIFPTNNVSA